MSRLGYKLVVFAFAFAFAFALGSSGCAPSPARSSSDAGAGAPPRSSAPASSSSAAERTARSEHFDVVWTGDRASVDEVQRTLDGAEEARSKLVELLGPSRVRGRFRVRLGGDATERDFPHVAPDTGEIMLYRFPGEGGAYEAPLAHELVHAARYEIWKRPERQTDAGLFWEEGFAEVIAREAGLPSAGFPLYGTAPDVAAASFLLRGEALPISALLAEHRSLSLRCMAQAYVARISFMTHVRERFGLERLIAIAYIDRPLDVSDIERVLGERREALVAAYDEALAASARAPEASATATAFREKTPIRYFSICPV